jgi:hypothetical protein
MPRHRPPYPAEFRRQMVDLVRSGRTPEGVVAGVRAVGPGDLELGASGRIGTAAGVATRACRQRSARS